MTKKITTFLKSLTNILEFSIAALLAVATLFGVRKFLFISFDETEEKE